MLVLVCIIRCIDYASIGGASNIKCVGVKGVGSNVEFPHRHWWGRTALAGPGISELVCRHE